MNAALELRLVEIDLKRCNRVHCRADTAGLGSPGQGSVRSISAPSRTRTRPEGEDVPAIRLIKHHVSASDVRIEDHFVSKIVHIVLHTDTQPVQ